MEISRESRSSQDIYQILIGTVFPQPIAWVSTVDTSGKEQLTMPHCSTKLGKFYRLRAINLFFAC